MNASGLNSYLLVPQHLNDATYPELGRCTSFKVPNKEHIAPAFDASIDFKENSALWTSSNSGSGSGSASSGSASSGSAGSGSAGSGSISNSGSGSSSCGKGSDDF